MRKSWNKKFLDNEKIVYLYRNKSLRQIAELFKCDRDVIRRILVENNVKIRNHSEAKKLHPQRYWLGKKRDPETIKKMKLFLRGHIPWNKGKRFLQICGKKNLNWKGGITPKHLQIRHSLRYKKWRMKVFQRDKFTCVICGYRSKKSYAHGDKMCDIRADHIKPFSLYPKLRFKVSNGRTLCLRCDRRFGYNFQRNKKGTMQRGSIH